MADDLETLRLRMQMRQVQERNRTRPPERGFWHAVGDNVVGYDDGVDSLGERVGTGIRETLFPERDNGQIGGPVAQFGAGSQQGIARGLGFPVDAVTGGINALGMTTGMWEPIEQPLLGSEHIDSMIAPLRANVEDPQSGIERVIRRTGEEVGSGVSMLPLAFAAPAVRAAPVAAAATEAGSSIGAGIGGGIANEIAPDSAIADIIGSLSGGIAGGGAIARQFDVTPRQQLVEEDIPTDELRRQASGFYDAARASGAIAPRADVEGMTLDLMSLATREGIVTPTGRVAESYPRIRHVLNLAEEYALGDMPVENMQAMRRTLQDAAGSTDNAERRIGREMLRQFDDWTAQFSPELAEARGLYRRAMGGQMMEQAMDVAEARSAQFSQSGMENALRTGFRQMDMGIARGQAPYRGMTDDQIDAIRRVSRGGPVENFARGVGRAAPTGVVSAGIGGGMPFLIGNAVGGPAVGAAASGLTMGAGLAGRAAANSMARNNASVAEALMRSTTGRMPTGSYTNVHPVIAALLAAEAAERNN